MQKTICKRVYDTDASTVVKKVCVGAFGDAAGYEETLYVTADGLFFVYTNGGEESPYPTADIKRMSKTSADKWLEAHA